MAKKRKSRKKNNPVISVIVVIVFMLLSSFVTFKAVYNCDHCGKISFGAGYAPNKLTGMFTAEHRICESCASQEHDDIFSKELEEYKLTIDWTRLDKPVD